MPRLLTLTFTTTAVRTEAAWGSLKPPPTRRLRRAYLHLSYSMTISRLLDTTAHRSGHEPLDSSGSCHPRKPAGFRQDKEFLRFPVDSILTWVTCPLRSTDITPLPRYY